jgi:pyruvate dehydrogenase E2 component (dihydrolipoamide acetyltransferase)
VPTRSASGCPGRYVVLGTDGFGRSDYRAQLRRFFEVDRYYTSSWQALKALADEGKVEASVVTEGDQSTTSIRTSRCRPRSERPAEPHSHSANEHRKQAMATKTITVPDIGDFDEVDVIEVLVSEGDTVEAEQSLITLESDKATMEVPAPEAGIVKSVRIKVGDKVKEGSVIMELEPTEGAGAGRRRPVPRRHRKPNRRRQPGRPRNPKHRAPPHNSHREMPVTDHPAHQVEADQSPVPHSDIDSSLFRKAHASPVVRRFARELGVDLSKVQGSGRKGRILKDDVQQFVKGVMQQGPATAAAAATGGAGIPPIPPVDFGRFGDIEEQPLSRIKRISGPHLQRSWLNVPHVTQFDEADITDLEAFRKAEKDAAEKHGVKLTPLAFLVKACAGALKASCRNSTAASPRPAMPSWSQEVHQHRGGGGHAPGAGGAGDQGRRQEGHLPDRRDLAN